MTIEQVQELLREEYEKSKRLEYVKNPIAYAVYQVWKTVYKKSHKETDLTNKCGSCKWSVQCKFSEKSSLGCYVECQNPNKKWRSEISKKRQRTTHKCRYYEMALAEREGKE